MRLRLSLVVAVFVSVFVSLCALRSVATASPDDDKATARKEFDAGVEADRHKDWAGALGHYLRANDLLEHPFTIFNIATDYERLGKLRTAGEWWRKYLDRGAAAGTDPADLAKARQQLADLEARPGPLTVRSTPSGARAFIDGAPAGVTPFTATVRGGSHRVAIEHEGQRTERDVRLTYGEPQDLNISLGAQPATILVFGTPAGATIYVDGQPSGTLPSAQVPVPAGSHEVRVVSVGFAPFSTTADAPGGGIVKVPVALERGTDGSAPTSTAGLLIGYYLGFGGGADGGGKGGVFRTEFGVTAGHYDIGLGIGKLGDDTVVDLGLRYVFGSARFAPFIAGSYVFSSGGMAAVGLRADLFRSPVASVYLLAQGAVEYYSPISSETSNTGSMSSSSGVLAFPISLSIAGSFGRRVPTPGSTPAVVPGAAPGTPAPGAGGLSGLR